MNSPIPGFRLLTATVCFSLTICLSQPAALAQAVLKQARAAFPGAFGGDSAIEHVCAERRATFTCRPGVRRPPSRIAERLAAAGDYVDGPYPSTIEGAVRAGRLALSAAVAACAPV